MSSTGPRNLLLALLLAGVAGGGSAYAVDAQRDADLEKWDRTVEAPPLPPGGRLQEAIDEIRRDGVHVADDARWMVSEQAEREIERAAATSGHQVLTIVWTPSDEAGDGYEKVAEKLEQEFSGEQVVIYVYEGPAEGDVVVVGAYPYQFGFSSFTDFVGDPETLLPRAVLDAEQIIDWELADPPEHEGYWGGRISQVAAGAVIGIGATGLLLLFLHLLHLFAGRGFLFPGRWTWHE